MDVRIFQRWASREYTATFRLLALIPEFLVFVVVGPLCLIWVSSFMDRLFHWPRLDFGVVNAIVGLILIVPFGLLGLWSVHAVFTKGRGTPAPFMPTHQLVVNGPYAYCRNPMVLGVLLAYGGLALWLGSFSATGLT